MSNDNLIQFARLICEINATQDTLDWIALIKEMDTTAAKIADVFYQAHIVWETYKIEGGE